MRRMENPDRTQLDVLSQRKAHDDREVRGQVSRIIQRVRSEGDAALRAYAAEFDRANIEELRVDAKELDAGCALVEPSLRAAIDRALANILKFHRAQVRREVAVETEPGITCWRKQVPIQRVGLYVPGGTAPLFSTVLMLAVPAMVAACRQTLLCTPPRPDGSIHPAILYCAAVTKIGLVLKCGGAQAIAAMAYGTESVPRVDKIFGPGNRYVTAAKQLVAMDGCAIDMPAGPSEVMVLADGNSNAAFVAADLLSQAEHGADSQCIVVVRDQHVANARRFIDAVEGEIAKQSASLDRIGYVDSSLANSLAITVGSTAGMLDVVDAYAPEHLVIQTNDAHELAAAVTNAGSVFIGPWAPESVGDYASGTNHTLPTAGWAASHSGLSVDSFVKTITFQHLERQALASLGPTVVAMAQAESLQAHAQAVKIRLEHHTMEDMA